MPKTNVLKETVTHLTSTRSDNFETILEEVTDYTEEKISELHRALYEMKEVSEIVQTQLCDLEMLVINKAKCNDTMEKVVQANRVLVKGLAASLAFCTEELSDLREAKPWIKACGEAAVEEQAE